ncbi:MAG: hypothetical protein JWS12_832 [Candidatus Saccharibacteria bacterium]|nr:hypothetical protein [Candidatus Saccharibacteria bacterium]
MAENFPEDTSEEEQRFIATPIGKALLGGELVLSAEAAAALEAIKAGDFHHPVIQRLRADHD